MRNIIGAVFASVFLMACGSGETEKSEAVKAKPEQPVLTEDTGQKFLEGVQLSSNEIEALGKNFGSKLTDLKLEEAKECWVGLYTQSLHFQSGNPTGFDFDFTQGGREQSEADRLTFAYYGFDNAVNRLEKDKAILEMIDAPESAKNQILKDGAFHQSVTSLARCKVEDMILEDSYLPYYQIYCVAAGPTKRQQQNELQAKMQNHCAPFCRNFL